MYAATRGPNVKWGAQISNGGSGTTNPPAGDGPALCKSEHDYNGILMFAMNTFVV